MFQLLKSHKWKSFTDELKKTNETFDVNMRDEQFNYFLTYAVIYNKYDIVKLLLDKGARIDITDNDGKTLLFTPIKYNYMDILKLLLETNNNVIGVNIIDMRDKFNMTPLHYAIILKNIDAVKLLIKYNSNPNSYTKDGFNSLHLAIYSREPQICEIIINNISNINSQCDTGETALHIACNLQLKNIVEILLKNKANVNIQDHELGITPVFYSVKQNDSEITKLLIEHNINPNIQDYYGNTIINQLIIEDNYELFVSVITSEKIKHIINLNLWNRNGEIPLIIALKLNSDNLMKYIDMLIDKTNFTLQDSDGNNCLYYIIKLELWKQYKNKLVNKKLDIFATNKNHEAPINIIPIKDYKEFIELIVDSYYQKLHSEIVWKDEWENKCNNEVKCKREVRNKISSLTKKFMDGEKLKCYERSYPVKKSKVCLSINDNDPVQFCTFTGCTLDILIGLIYLLKKHNSSCSTITKNFYQNKDLCKFYKSIGIVLESKCEVLNFEIIWVNKNLYIIENFSELFNDCIKKGKRFIIIPIGIEMSNGNHSNYLIYDSKLNEIERFEPNGYSNPYKFNYNPSLLDEVLENKFKGINEKMKYFRPKDYLPKIGFQIFDSFDTDRRKIGDPLGYCVAWSTWYVDMRLTYSEIDRKKLVRSLLKNIRRENISFRNLIRNYSLNITKIRDNILNKEKMDINDWMNDNYTNVQFNEIIKQLIILMKDIK
jgi:ankyrin repeat protein